MAKEMLNDAQRKMVEENMGLVHKVLQDKVCFLKSSSMGWDDLFQSGCLALCNAAAKFDASKSFCFSTYAYRAIQTEIINSLLLSRNRDSNESSADGMLVGSNNRDRDDNIGCVSAIELFADKDKTDFLLRADLQRVFDVISKDTSITETQKKWIRAFLYSLEGYDCETAGVMQGATEGNGRNYVSRGRILLRNRKDVQALWKETA